MRPYAIRKEARDVKVQKGLWKEQRRVTIKQPWLGNELEPAW